MATLQEIKNRIKVINTTVKTTKVMQLVSTSKLKKARHRLAFTNEYLKAATDCMEQIYGINKNLNEKSNSLLPLADLIQKNEARRIIYILITSNKGLCGKLNMALLKESAAYLQNKPSLKEIELFPIGHKFSHAKSKFLSATPRLNINNNSINLETDPSDAIISYIDSIYDKYILDKYDDVIFAYNKFNNFFSQDITIASFSENLSLIADKPPIFNYFILDNDPQILLQKALKGYFCAIFWSAIANNLASEHAMRVASMDNATRNGQKMGEQLLLVYNKTRQAFITKDLIDIISSSNAVNS